MNNESGFDPMKEELMLLSLVNCFLVDYEGQCPYFAALASKIPLPSILRRETDLLKLPDHQSTDRVVAQLTPRMHCSLRHLLT